LWRPNQNRRETVAVDASMTQITRAAAEAEGCAFRRGEGTGEGAARWLIKDRIEITGARWGLEGAEAVLKLRALVGNGDFDTNSGRKNYATTTASTSSHRN
jgi:hypothetical protein